MFCSVQKHTLKPLQNSFPLPWREGARGWEIILNGIFVILGKVQKLYSHACGELKFSPRFGTVYPGNFCLAADHPFANGKDNFNAEKSLCREGMFGCQEHSARVEVNGIISKEFTWNDTVIYREPGNEPLHCTFPDLEEFPGGGHESMTIDRFKNDTVAAGKSASFNIFLPTVRIYNYNRNMTINIITFHYPAALVTIQFRHF